jgi:pyruvate kinase
MNPAPLPRTKIVATIGPSSNSPQVIRHMLQAGMAVARLNFSHGSHQDHARSIALLREISSELNRPVTILQDLQGPKIRVGRLSQPEMTLVVGQSVSLFPEAMAGSAGFDAIPLDYPHLAEEARPGMTVLIADGAMELEVTEVAPPVVHCKVREGGTLKSRKGVNFPQLALRLPALTDKDQADVIFGLRHAVDWISLSFVRSAADVRALRDFIESQGGHRPVLAKIEKPQAIDNLDSIISEADGLMVARGDLGVEMRPEQVPMLQKHIIESCNRMGKPVITATQMLESMIYEARPTRAEASDVANAIVDGTDAVMLSGESAIGAYPVRAVEMMVRIAREVEGKIGFKSYPPAGNTCTHALSRAVNVMEDIVSPRCIVVLTTSGHTARSVAADRPKSAIIALTNDPEVYHSLNLFWGIHPLLIEGRLTSFEGLVGLAENKILEAGLGDPGELILILGGVPAGTARGTNFVKLHYLSSGAVI